LTEVSTDFHVAENGEMTLLSAPSLTTIGDDLGDRTEPEPPHLPGQRAGGPGGRRGDHHDPGERPGLRMMTSRARRLEFIPQG
jgi:hypothetical protein